MNSAGCVNMRVELDRPRRPPVHARGTRPASAPANRRGARLPSRGSALWRRWGSAPQLHAEPSRHSLPAVARHRGRGSRRLPADTLSPCAPQGGSAARFLPQAPFRAAPPPAGCGLTSELRLEVLRRWEITKLVAVLPSLSPSLPPSFPPSLPPSLFTQVCLLHIDLAG